MIRGIVTAGGEPVVKVRVVGPTQVEELVDALIDTGYTGFLALPSHLITKLDLIYRGPGSAGMADGSQIRFNTYDALIEWDGAPRPVLVSALGSQPVIGMGLLDGHELRV